MSARRFDLLVFDWDGTLMDSTGTIVHAIRLAFNETGLADPGEEKARYVIGFALQEAMAYLAPGATPEQLQAVTDAYRRHYLARDQELVLFAGVREGLQRLTEAGFTLAVATGKSRAGLDRSLKVGQLGDIFLVTRTADESFSKPHPAMLEYVMDVAGVEPERTLMIGDTTHDMQLAINAGTASLALGYGAHAGEDLLPLNPLGLFHDFPALVDWILVHG